jgi:hypothetical protein
LSCRKINSDAYDYFRKMASRQTIYITAVCVLAGAVLALFGVQFYAVRDPKLLDPKVLQRPIDTERDAHAQLSLHPLPSAPVIPPIVTRTPLQPGQRCVAGVMVQQQKGDRGEIEFRQLVENRSLVRCEADFRIDVRKQG